MQQPTTRCTNADAWAQHGRNAVVLYGACGVFKQLPETMDSTTLVSITALAAL
jgi:hypothetical protein